MVNLVSLTTADRAFFSDVQTANFPLWSFFLRPNDTTAYSTGDVISNSTSTACQLHFPGSGVSGCINSAHLVIESAGATADFELFIFDRVVTDHLDNAALALAASDMTAIVHRFTFLNTARSAINASTHYYEMDGNVRFQTARAFTSTTGALYGLLVLRSGSWTPTALTRVAVRLSVESK